MLRRFLIITLLLSLAAGTAWARNYGTSGTWIGEGAVTIPETDSSSASKVTSMALGHSTMTALTVVTDGGTVTIDGSVSGRKDAASLASGNLTVNAVNLATAGAADYTIPDGNCDAAGDVGTWVTVTLQDASVVVSISSSDASNIIYVPGLGLGAGDELDSVSTAAHEGQSITLTCLEVDKWYFTGGNLLTSAGAIAWADGGPT